jgi:hypothetical protein
MCRAGFPGHFDLPWNNYDGVDAHNNRVRFQWKAGGTAEAPLRFVGTDFGCIATDGRLESITGFLDEAPGLPAKKEHE